MYCVNVFCCFVRGMRRVQGRIVCVNFCVVCGKEMRSMFIAFLWREGSEYK